VLGLLATTSPLVLFSGHHQMQSLLDGEVSGSLGLIALAVARLVALLACLATGWFGGEIFPAAMVGMAAAMGVGMLVGTDASVVLGVAGMVGAGVAVLRRPVAGFLLFVVVLPASYAGAVALAAVVAAVLCRTVEDGQPGDEAALGTA
jgi:H+/Cl- antiporter ClcA